MNKKDEDVIRYGIFLGIEGEDAERPSHIEDRYQSDPEMTERLQAVKDLYHKCLNEEG